MSDTGYTPHDAPHSPHGLTVLCVIILHAVALPLRAAGAPADHEGWNVAVYPILAWLPLSIGIDVNIPPFEGNVGGAGNIVDSRLATTGC